MFIFNVKFSKTKIFKGILAIMAIVCIALTGAGIFKMYTSNSNLETFR